MSLPWFRLYAEFAGDPVVQSMAFEDQRHYIMVLCLKCGGTLDRAISAKVRDGIICRGLGLDPTSASEAKRRLMEVGLIDKDWQPTGWGNRQFTSDTSTDRVRKYRKNKKTGNKNETLRETDKNSFGNAPDTDTDTDTDTDKDNPRGATAPRYSPEDYALAEQMFSTLRQLNPKHKKPSFDKWATEIRLIRERDGHSLDEIRSLWCWANGHHFWKTNILSPGTLREKWDRLTIQRNSEGSNGSHPAVDNSAIAKVRRANEEARKQEARKREAAGAIDGKAERVDDDDVND